MGVCPLKYFFVYRAKRRVFYRPVFARAARAFPFPLYNGMHAPFFCKKDRLEDIQGYV